MNMCFENVVAFLVMGLISYHKLRMTKYTRAVVFLSLWTPGVHAVNHYSVTFYSLIPVIYMDEALSIWGGWGSFHLGRLKPGTKLHK